MLWDLKWFYGMLINLVDLRYTGIRYPIFEHISIFPHTLYRDHQDAWLIPQIKGEQGRIGIEFAWKQSLCKQQTIVSCCFLPKQSPNTHSFWMNSKGLPLCLEVDRDAGAPIWWTASLPGRRRRNCCRMHRKIQCAEKMHCKPQPNKLHRKRPQTVGGVGSQCTR